MAAEDRRQNEARQRIWKIAYEWIVPAETMEDAEAILTAAVNAVGAAVVRSGDVCGGGVVFEVTDEIEQIGDGRLVGDGLP